MPGEHKAGALLRSPIEVTSSNAETCLPTEVKYHRQGIEDEESVKNLSDRFRLIHKDFQRQYFHVYSRRLESLRSAVEKAAKSQISKDILIKPLCQLETVEENQNVLIVGTIFKNQDLKPNILKELSEESGVPPQPLPKKYISEDDDLVLEDDLQRIRVRGDVSVSSLVTGIVCGLYGAEKESGKFYVQKVVLPELPVQVERPLWEADRYIVFFSGLELSDTTSSSMLALQLAVDWITGEAGEMKDQEENASIIRVVIAGNSLSESTKDKEGLKKAKYLTKDAEAGSIEAVNVFDNFLSELAGSVNTDLMPGAFDPASHILPQQPLHPCLFPGASAYSTLKTVSNPYFIEIKGTLLFGTSGQNVDDIMRNTSMEDPLDAMEALISWRHLAPTSPDTLGCFPYKDKDPFIMDSLPHVFFAGNQAQFSQRYIDRDIKIKLLCIPSFIESKSVVRLNLRTLQAEEIKFHMKMEE